MPDENLDEITREQDGDDDTIKKLRKLLKSYGQENKQLKSQTQELTLSQQINEAGLNLKPRQLKALKAELAGEDEITVESIKEIADDLGFSSQTTQDPNQAAPQTPPDASQNGSQMLQVPHDPNAPQNGAQGVQAIPPHLAQSAGAMGDMTAAATGQPPAPQSLEDALRATTNIDEWRNVVRSRGQEAGLVHEWDVE